MSILRVKQQDGTWMDIPAIKGDPGEPGSPGKDGTPVTVKSVSESSADGGKNVVTFSDGKTVTIKNGSKGSAGETPERGTDYWTDADQESIVQQVIFALQTPVFGTVDEENNIILTGELPDGTYTLKYEYADGDVVTIGTLVHGSYTNLADPSSAEWLKDKRLNSRKIIPCSLGHSQPLEGLLKNGEDIVI